MEADILRAAHLLAASQRLVVLTGAGMSQESGIPTFRDPGTGVWAQTDPMAVASIAGFMQDPDRSWQWHDHLRELVRQARPNPGHVALARLEDILPRVVVVTQNIDDLHQRAGSRDVIPIHGTLAHARCFFDCLGRPTVIAFDDLEDYRPGENAPKCPHCGRWARPDVVWFGESLPEEAINRAFLECEKADVMLVIGTSGVVQPAASLPFVARQHGALLIDVNPFEDEIHWAAEVWLQGPSGRVLPRLVDAVRRLLGEST
ncbi:MAG: NAD-dependent protein deacetylase [Anaerolineae bacterium]